MGPGAPLHCGGWLGPHMVQRPAPSPLCRPSSPRELLCDLLLPVASTDLACRETPASQAASSRAEGSPQPLPAAAGAGPEPPLKAFLLLLPASAELPLACAVMGSRGPPCTHS